MNDKVKAPALWFSVSGKHNTEQNLGFYDPKLFEWASEVEAKWEVIHHEIEAFMMHHSERIQPYFNTDMVSGQNQWKAFGFLFWSWKYPENMAQCPATLRLLQSIPGLVSASISILEANTEIKAHKGDTNAIYRCHLGLKVPAGLPACGMRVAGEEQEWREGKLLVFNDAAEHAAWNYSDTTRYVLLFDVIRPEFMSKKQVICARVLSGIRMQLLRQKSPLVRKSPRVVQSGIAFFIRQFIRLALRFKT